MEMGRGRRHREEKGHTGGHGAAPWENRDEKSGLRSSDGGAPRDVVLAGKGPGL